MTHRRLDKSQIFRGKFMTGAPGAGQFVAKRAPLPDDLREFEQAAARADELAAMERQHAAAVAEIARRLQAVRDGLDAIKKVRGK